MSITDLERLVVERRYLAARDLFRQVMAGDGFPVDTYALACHLTAVAESGLGNYQKAVLLAKEADQHAEKQKDWDLVARVGQNLIGFLWLIGDYGLALERGKRWLSDLDRYPDNLPRRGRVEYNLALVCREMGDDRQARELLTKAEETMERADNQPDQLVSVLQMQARLAYEAEDFEAGDRAWQKAEGLIDVDDVEGSREQLLLRSFRSFFALDYDEALMIVEEFVAPNAVTTVLQKLAAVWIAGMTAAKQGRFALAREMVAHIQRLNMDGETIISTRYANGATEILRRVKLAEDLAK